MKIENVKLKIMEKRRVEEGKGRRGEIVKMRRDWRETLAGRE